MYLCVSDAGGGPAAARPTARPAGGGVVVEIETEAGPTAPVGHAAAPAGMMGTEVVGMGGLAGGWVRGEKGSRVEKGLQWNYYSFVGMRVASSRCWLSIGA